MLTGESSMSREAPLRARRRHNMRPLRALNPPQLQFYADSGGRVGVCVRVRIVRTACFGPATPQAFLFAWLVGWLAACLPACLPAFLRSLRLVFIFIPKESS